MPEEAAGLAPPGMASIEFDGLRVTTLSEITGTEILGGMPEACKTFYARWEYYNRGDAPLEPPLQGDEPLLQLAASLFDPPAAEVEFTSIVREAPRGSIGIAGFEQKREEFSDGLDSGVRSSVPPLPQNVIGNSSASYILAMLNLPRFAAPAAAPAINLHVGGPGYCETTNQECSAERSCYASRRMPR